MVSICTTMTVNNMEIIPLKVTGGLNHWATPKWMPLAIWHMENYLSFKEWIVYTRVTFHGHVKLPEGIDADSIRPMIRNPSLKRMENLYTEHPWIPR